MNIDSLQRLHDMQTEPGYDDREPSDAEVRRVRELADAEASFVLEDELDFSALMSAYRLAADKNKHDRTPAENALMTVVDNAVEWPTVMRVAQRRYDAERDKRARDERNADRGL